MASTSAAKDATTVYDLTQLIGNPPTQDYPNDDTLLGVLNARFRFDLPYTRIGSSGLVVVNPLKSLANTNDASAADYEEKTYRDVDDTPTNLQPHLYELASRVYLMLRRTSESQSVIFRFVLPASCIVCPDPVWTDGTANYLYTSQRHHWFRQVPQLTAPDQSTPSTLLALKKGYEGG